ncbi:peptidoglycan editing factor PgeF [Alteromonas genovensis]|uniref:Purine nucleoside phosphorylase n=1 Tax=Alteromonas genovensis TaxID=471225 RepID=A0A6N9TFZ8_9ALTE|nr:peptidoglycan editing factor PgeF [Alteromonas genovensis]NDW14459.1 peptidoglycan editing factor PgeF [Alteromonas genovensis]
MSSAERFIIPECFPDNVVAYTSTRCGGVSDKFLVDSSAQEGKATQSKSAQAKTTQAKTAQENSGAKDYLGLNIGAHVGDDIISVRENRARLPHSEKITWLEQVHGNTIATLPTLSVEADASFSSRPEHFCAVMTADCVPVLISDNRGKEVAAIHAGWKGLEATIIADAVTHFSTDPSQLIAWVGPAICGQCYEVNEALANKFSYYKNCVTPKKQAGKYLLDLPQIANQQLTHLGIKHVEQSHYCTYCRSDLFYSHRKATHSNFEATGRIVSVIGKR